MDRRKKVSRLPAAGEALRTNSPPSQGKVNQPSPGEPCNQALQRAAGAILYADRAARATGAAGPSRISGLATGEEFYDSSHPARALSLRSPHRAPSFHIPAPDGPIRVFDDAPAHALAQELGAHAFTWHGDVFLGATLDQPFAPSRGMALRHERVHAQQMRRRGPVASESALEKEADSGNDRPLRAAAPDRPLGLWWVIPVAVGAYILLRPKVANAPGPGDPVYRSPSEAQIVGEALALFAVPAGVAGGLARLGYSVVGAYAIAGATSTVSFRGVQDVGAGEFSGIEAYVVDAGTGAVIGVVMGGVVRLAPNVFSRAPGVSPASQPVPPLVHLTTAEGQAGIQASSVLRGSGGIYAVPSQAASEATAMRVMRTLLRPSHTSHVVPLPQSAAGSFAPPNPYGPLSLYQRMMGVYRAPAGSINLATGAHQPSGRLLSNVTGQFFPYGADAMFWISAAGIGSALSPAREGAYERGVAGLIAGREPLPQTQLTDGPFVLIDDPAAVELLGSQISPTELGGLIDYPPALARYGDYDALEPFAAQSPSLGATTAAPAIILVVTDPFGGASR